MQVSLNSKIHKAGHLLVTTELFTFLLKYIMPPSVTCNVLEKFADKRNSLESSLRSSKTQLTSKNLNYVYCHNY